MTGKAFLTHAGFVISVSLLTACSAVPNLTPTISIEEMSAEQIYQTGENALARGKQEDAASYFGDIERLFPYSDWASKGLIMQADALHQAGKFDASRASAQRYLTFYPTMEDAAKAQYLVALSYYDQIYDIGRDRGLTINALQELRKVIEFYPNSPYAEEAKPKFDLAFDHLAGKEMEVGRFYLGRGDYTAAINRFKVVVEDFQTTRHTPEALYRLVEANLSLGLNGEAQSAAAILQQDFAESEWYADAMMLLNSEGLAAGNSGSGWLSRIYSQTIKGNWL